MMHSNASILFKVFQNFSGILFQSSEPERVERVKELGELSALIRAISVTNGSLVIIHKSFDLKPIIWSGEIL